MEGSGAGVVDDTDGSEERAEGRPCYHLGVGCGEGVEGGEVVALNSPMGI